MVHQCLAQITLPWGTATTMAGTTGPLSLHLEEDSATVEMEAPGEFGLIWDFEEVFTFRRAFRN